MSVFVADTGQFTGDAGSDIATIAAGGFLVIAKVTVTASQQQWYGKTAVLVRALDTGRFSTTVARATTSLEISADLTNFTTYNAGGWNVFASRWNAAGANGDQQLFIAKLAGAFAEPSAYFAQSVGSGTQTDDSAVAVTLLNASNGSRDMTSPTFAIALFNSYPSVMDFLTVRDRLLETNPRPVLPSNVARAWRFDRNGTGGVRDLVKHGVATPSSTIKTAPDPPRRYPVRAAAWDVLPTQAGGGRGIRFDRRRRFLAAEG